MHSIGVWQLRTKAQTREALWSEQGFRLGMLLSPWLESSLGRERLLRQAMDMWLLAAQGACLSATGIQWPGQEECGQIAGVL